MITANQIQQKLIEEIKRSGFKQIELSRKLFVSKQEIYYYIHGKKLPDLDIFANLCVILDIDPDDILCTDLSRNE